MTASGLGTPPPSHRKRRRKQGKSQGKKYGQCVVAALIVIALIVGGVVWMHGRSCSRVSIIYDGYGTVSCDRTSVTLSPMSATRSDETHAALVELPQAEISEDVTSVVRTTMTTTAQLRTGTDANPWEVGWLLWNYTDDTQFYALALKPNGWEVSKQDTDYQGSQRYLETGNSPTYAIGTSHDVQVTLVPLSEGLQITIEVDGEILTTVTDTESPYRTGTVALYCEDATVTFSNTEIMTSSQ